MYDSVKIRHGTLKTGLKSERRERTKKWLKSVTTNSNLFYMRKLSINSNNF